MIHAITSARRHWVGAIKGEYRVTKSIEAGEVVDSIPAVEAIVRENGQGRYHADEHAAELLPGSKDSARAWGAVIHNKDGEVVLEPHPWDQHWG
jgi:hypothetical protein